MRDCNTLATLNLILGTLQDILSVLAQINTCKVRTTEFYLSFDALTTRGSRFVEVISEPRTGANREIACRIVIRYR